MKGRDLESWRSLLKSADNLLDICVGSAAFESSISRIKGTALESWSSRLKGADG